MLIIYLSSSCYPYYVFKNYFIFLYFTGFIHDDERNEAGDDAVQLILHRSIS